MSCLRLMQHPRGRLGLLAALLLLVPTACAPAGTLGSSDEEGYDAALERPSQGSPWAGGPQVEVECLGLPYLGTWNPLGFLGQGAANRFTFQVCGPAAALDVGLAALGTDRPVALRLQDPSGQVRVLDTRDSGVALLQLPQPMVGTWSLETWNLARTAADFEVSLRVE